MKTTNVNGQNGVATSANTSFSLYADSWANFGYIKRMEFTELNKTELIRFIGQPISMYKSDTHFCLEFGDERYCIFIYKNEKGYYVTVHETSSKTVQRPVKEVIRHYCDCFRLTEKKIDNIVNYIYDLVANYFNGFYETDITKSEFEKEYTDNLNSPDAYDESDVFIGLENASEECDNNMMACVDKYGQEFVDAVIKECADGVEKAVSNYDLDDTINYCVKEALGDMEYDPDEKRLVGCSLVPDLCDWDDEDEFCEYFEDTYGFDWDSCKEFYEEYCNEIWQFADEYDDRMEDALKDFDEESVFDKMFYKIDYDGEYINVYIDMDDFVDYIHKKIIIFNNFNSGNAQLFKYENLGLRLYYYDDPDNKDNKDNKDIKQFYDDLISMAPMVTDVKLYDDGLYVYHMTFNEYFKEIPISLDLKNITISEYYKLSEKIIDGSTKFVDGCFNYYIRKSQYCSSCGDVTHYYYDVVYYINGCAIVKFYGENLSMAEIIENFREYMPKEIHSMICYDLGI